jgi:MFS family permease
MASQSSTDVVEEEFQEVSPYTKALAKRVLRKIDLRVLLIMFITYNLNFMDKTILSSAAVFGLEDDNHLVGTQYSWVGSIFYFGYLAFEYPATLLIQKLPIGKYLASVCLLWGAIVACTAACTSFGGLATCRFLLGVAVCLPLNILQYKLLRQTCRKQAFLQLSYMLLAYGILVMKFRLAQASGLQEIAVVDLLPPS